MLKKLKNRKNGNIFAPGEMAERSNAAVLKTVVPARVPGVRIPLSPLKIETRFPRVFLFTPLSTSKVD